MVGVLLGVEEVEGVGGVEGMDWKGQAFEETCDQNPDFYSPRVAAASFGGD